MFHLFDTYAAGISLLCSALFEAIAVSWFYGLNKLTQDVDAMLGWKPGLYWRICWKFVSPTFIIVNISKPETISLNNNIFIILVCCTFWFNISNTLEIRRLYVSKLG